MAYDLYNHHVTAHHITDVAVLRLYNTISQFYFMLHDLFALSILIVPFIMVSRRLRTNAVLHAPTVLADLQYLFLFVSVVSYMAHPYRLLHRGLFNSAVNGLSINAITVVFFWVLLGMFLYSGNMFRLQLSATNRITQKQLSHFAITWLLPAVGFVVFYSYIYWQFTHLSLAQQQWWIQTMGG